MAVKYLNETYEEVQRLTTWQKLGLQQTASGYGRKLTTSKVIRITGQKVWRRVYATCYSNSASLWVTVKGEKLYIR